MGVVLVALFCVSRAENTVTNHSNTAIGSALTLVINVAQAGLLLVIIY